MNTMPEMIELTEAELDVVAAGAFATNASITYGSFNVGSISVAGGTSTSSGSATNFAGSGLVTATGIVSGLNVNAVGTIAGGG